MQTAVAVAAAVAAAAAENAAATVVVAVVVTVAGDKAGLAAGAPNGPGPPGDTFPCLIGPFPHMVSTVQRWDGCARGKKIIKKTKKTKKTKVIGTVLTGKCKGRVERGKR